MKGVRTIALRLTGTKEAAEELEEMGEDTSDMIMSQSKMRDLIMNATKVASNNYKGFDIQDELGRYKSTFEIMLGLSQIWDEIRQADLKSGDNRQNLLLESIAGKNRASIASSILQNPDILQSVYQDSSTKAANSAMEENQKYLESISGHLAKLKNAWQEMWASAANRDVINGIIDLGTGILNLINNVGGLRLAFMALFTGTIVKGLFNANSLLVKYIQLLNNSRSAAEIFSSALVKTDETGNPVSRLQGLEKIKETIASSGKSSANEEENTSLEKLNATKKENIQLTMEEAEANKIATESSVEKSIATEGEAKVETEDTVTNAAQAVSEELVDKTKKKSIATDIAKTASQEKETAAQVQDIAVNEAQKVSETGGEIVKSAGSLATIGKMIASPFFVIPIALMGIMALMSKIKADQQALVDGAKEAASTWESTESNLGNYEQKYKDLTTQLQNQNLSETEQLNIKQQIYDLQKQITDEYGKSAEGINLVNGNLDEQLQKMRQLRVESQAKNYSHNAKEYDNAIKKLDAPQTYRMTLTMGSGQEFYEQYSELKKVAEEAGYQVQATEDGMEFSIRENTEKSKESLDILHEAMVKIQKDMGEEWDDSFFKKFNDQLSEAIKNNDTYYTQVKESGYTGLEGKFFDYENGEAVDLYFDYQQAASDYNKALLTDDKEEIEKTREAWIDLQNQAEAYFNSSSDKGQYRRLFEQYNIIDEALEKSYVMRTQMNSPEGKTAIEAAIGEYQVNKKISKKIQKEVLDAAENILNERKKVREWGLENAGIDPLSGLYPEKVKYGNVDMDNRPIIKWDKKAIKKYGAAANEFGGYEPGGIDTVRGESDQYGNVEIAYTPIFVDEKGKTQWFTREALTDYLNGLVTEATNEETGEVDIDKIIKIDGSKKSGKGIVAAVAKVGDTASVEMVRNLGASLHFIGKKGSIALGLKELSKSAKDAGMPMAEIIKMLKDTGQLNTLQNALSNTTMSVNGIMDAITAGGNPIADIAMGYNITAQSPTEEIRAFAEEIAKMGLAVGDTAEASDKALEHFFSDVSGKIAKVTSLASIVQKGLSQTGLSFTKLFDEQGNAIQSDVSQIIEAYKNIEGYDLGSLFEETATGIRLNMQAYRALAQQEESETKLMYELQRKALEAKLEAASPGAESDYIKKQITELDMLESAYEGATSAFAKYLNQQNASDYQNNYETIRDNAIKRGNELLNKGYVGTEEFRSIAQLFSYDSLATSGAEDVMKAYENGLANVKKYFTEDARDGMQQFLDDLMNMPYDFGTYLNSDMLAQMSDEQKQVLMEQTGLTEETLNQIDGYYLEFTEEQEAKLAESLGVSKDLVESFFHMLSGLGFETHFYKDGTLKEFDELNKKIKESQETLKGLKLSANDAKLVLDFDVGDLDSTEKIQEKITDIEALTLHLDADSDEYKAAIELIEHLKELLTAHEQNEIKAKVTIEDYDQAEEDLTTLNEQIDKMAEKNKEAGTIKFSVDEHGSKLIDELATKVEKLPPEIQTLYNLELKEDGTPLTFDEIVEQWQSLLDKKNVELGVAVKPEIDAVSSAAPEIEVGADVTDAQHTIDQLNDSFEPIDMQVEEAPFQKIKSLAGEAVQGIKAFFDVEPNPTSVEDAKTEVEQGIAQAEPQIHLAGDPISVAWNGISDHAVNINVGADTSEAETTIGEVQEQAEQPLEEPLKIIPENTVQDAANQAGAQQGVTTTKHEQTIQDTQINTTTTADTSALDAAQSKIAAFQSQSGANVVVTVNVIGTEKITDAQTKIAQLIQKAKAKINVTIGGNNTAFSKSYSDTISKLNEVAKKDTTAKIKGDNSNLKDKVSEAKNKLNSIDNKEVRITASASGFDTITNWKNSVYDKLKNKEIKIKTTYTSSGTKPSTAHGTAHVQGTVMRSGHAYANGLPSQWALKQDENGALINELGAEIVASKDGTWQILNNGDPTFANLKRGDIVFNHQQTADLLEKGYVKGSHGTIIGGMNAFATGTAKWNKETSGSAFSKSTGKIVKPSSGNNNSGNNNSSSGNHSSGNHSGGGNNSSSNKAAKDFLQTLDAIEIHLQRVDAEISRLDTNAAKTFEKFGDRSKSLTDEIALITKEVNKLNKSLSSGNQQGSDTTYANYFAKAKQAAKAAGAKNKDEGADAKKKNRPGDELSEYWTKRIKNAVDKGAMLTIDDVHDEGLWKKIQAFQTWYEKGVKLQQKKQEYLNKLAQLTITKLQLVQKSYESYLNLVSEQANTTQQLLEAQSALTKNATINRLDDLISYDQKRIEKLKDEKDDLQKGLDTAVKSGIIKKDSEEYRTWKTNIQKIQTDIRAAENDIVNQTNQKLEYIQSKWESTLELLDADIEKYDNLVTKNEYRQSVIPKIYEKGKKKGQYIPTGVTNDSTLGLYENIINKDKEKLKDLQKEYNSIERYLKQAVKDNIIQKNSETWKQWQSRLKTIRNDIIATENDVVEQVVSQLEYIENKWEAVLGDIEQRVDIFEARQELRTEKGYAASKGYYRKQIEGQQQRRTSLERERDDLRNRLMANLTIKTKIDENGNIVPERDKKGKTIANPNGTIVYGSQDYYDWANKIRGVTESIIETDKAIVKLDNDIRQLDWDAFDRVQEKIDNASEEADFLNSIIDEFDQFNKNGRITARGRASEGLIAQQYDLQMKNAQQYGKMVKSLNKQIANDPNNLDLIEQRDKWLKAQQQSIENAHKQKQAMADLIEKGIKKQIEAMSELVKKYEEMLDAQRSQEQYAKSIADKQKRINSLQKQLTAMGGDDSEEGKVRRQQLQNDLENAQEDLKDSQEDKRISDIKEALSNMQEKYEEILNARIEDIDRLFTETISVINRNGANITDTIEKIAKEVGYDITTVLEKTYNNVKNTKSDNGKGALVSDTGSNGQFKNAGATTVKNTPEATVKNGTYTENGKKVYYYNGKAVSGLFTTTEGKQRYYDPKTGKLAKGWTTVDKNKYYFDKNGNALTGVQKIGGSQYYFDKNGKLHTGTFVAGDKTYTTDKNGAITNVKDTTTLTGKTATVGDKNIKPTGKIVAGINVDKKPAAAKPTTPPASSPKTPTPSTPAKTTDAPSANYTGLWTDKSGNTYYYVKGKKQTGWKSMKEGKRYFSIKTGRMIKGLQTIGGASYYLDPKTGVLKTGSFTVSNNKYETDKNGKIIKKNGVAVKGHLAKGTASVRCSGMYQVDERGNEVFINKNGKIYTRLDKGTTVLPHDAAINLLKGMTNPTDFIMKNMDMRPNKNITTNNSTTGNTTNYITFDMSGISDYKEFMREAQRDPNFTKYIQEISLGKLNGNNSLKKNSIRFT